MLAGKTVTEAAKCAGVARCTVHAWLKEDFEFQATLYRGRRELRAAMTSRLLALGDKALNAVERALDGGDAKIALEILDGLRALKPPSLGLDDPKKLKRERIRLNQLQAHQRERQGQLFPFGEYTDHDPLM
jgi:hypothetical protein